MGNTKKDGYSLVVIIFCLVFILGVVGGTMYSDLIQKGITSLWDGLQRRVPTTFVPSGEEQLNNLSQQLVERVNDSHSHFQTLVSLLTVIVILIGIATGISIWRTDKYAKRLIDGLKEEELKPFLDSSKKELKEIHNTNKEELGKTHDSIIESLLGANKIIWDAISQKMKQLDESEVASLKDKKERESILSERAKNRETRYKMFSYIVRLGFRDEKDVINAAQQLGGMGKEAVDALPYLKRALDRWPPDSKARSEVQRANDKIKQASKQSE